MKIPAFLKKTIHAATLACAMFLAAGCSSPAPRRTDEELARLDMRAGENFMLGSIERAASLYVQGLNRARAMDDAGEVAEFAYNAAVCFAAAGRFDTAQALLREARAAASMKNMRFDKMDLLEARIEYRAGRADSASELVAGILSENPAPRIRLEALIIKARLELDAGRLESAGEVLEAARIIAGKNDESVLSAELSGLAGRLDFSEGRYAGAAEKHRRESYLLRKHGRYDGMAGALAREARALSAAGDNAGAAALFHRAARSFYGQSDIHSALEMIVPALEAADMAGDERMILLLTDLFEKIKSEPEFRDVE